MHIWIFAMSDVTESYGMPIGLLYFIQPYVFIKPLQIVYLVIKHIYSMPTCHNLFVMKGTSVKLKSKPF